MSSRRNLPGTPPTWSITNQPTWLLFFSAKLITRPSFAAKPPRASATCDRNSNNNKNGHTQRKATHLPFLDEVWVRGAPRIA